VATTPFVFLELGPEAHPGGIKHAQDWLPHAEQLLACTALTLRAYLALSGLAHLG
jgi:hypothetical protein